MIIRRFFYSFIFCYFFLFFFFWLLFIYLFIYVYLFIYLYIYFIRQTESTHCCNVEFSYRPNTARLLSIMSSFFFCFCFRGLFFKLFFLFIFFWEKSITSFSTAIFSKTTRVLSESLILQEKRSGSRETRQGITKNGI